MAIDQTEFAPPASGPENELIERTNHSTKVYEAAFGDLLTDDSVQTVADIGAGDSLFGPEYARHSGKTVYRLDPQYEQTPPPYPDKHTLVGRAQELPLEDGTVDLAISAFMFQHLPPEDVEAALKEMLRVTKLGGLVAVFPVFRPGDIRHAVNEDEFGSGMRIGYPGDEAQLSRRGLRFPTLAIRNSEDIFEPGEDGRTPLDRLVHALNKNKALQPRPTLGKLLRRARMRITGDTHFHTTGLE